MNHIKPLAVVFETMDSDPRFTPFHISLFMSLFRRWNLNYFESNGCLIDGLTKMKDWKAGVHYYHFLIKCSNFYTFLIFAH
jgi:hypothetical protein